MTEKVKDVKIGFTRVFAKTQASKAKVVINVGGARSSKSYSIAQLLVMKLTTETGKHIGICRKTFPALRMTTMGMFLAMLQDYGMYNPEWHNKSYNTYTYNGNLVQFFGLDEAEKIKSAEFNYIWMEEANEFTYEDYIALKLRLSGKAEEGELNQLFISLNPIDAHNWIATRAALEQDVEVIKSTYLDNPYLSEDYKRMLTDLINQDEHAYRVYVLGEWGLLEGKIYSNFKVIPQMPEVPGAKWAYGLDFGLVNPSAIIKVTMFKNQFYVEERLYQTGLTNADIIEFFSHEPRADIYGDPSAKMMLTEISRAGYSAFEGHRDVKAGIDLCQRQTLLIPQSSTHLITEIQNYHWKKDPNAMGQDAFMSEPVKYNDHCVDAMRYAIWGLTTRYGFATAAPHAQEPITSLHFNGGNNNNTKILDRWLRRNA